MTQWIVDNKEKQNIQYVMHTGDIVDSMDRESEWVNADKSMKILEDANIPYGVLAGNHDVGPIRLNQLIIRITANGSVVTDLLINRIMVEIAKTTVITMT